jgi:hypothetical protein
MYEDALEFGGKEDVVAALHDVKRLDAEAITAEDEALARVAPQSDAKHAAQVREACSVPLEEGVQNGFSIAVGVEAMAAGFELFADVEVIVDFAVESDGGVAVIGNDGLIAAGEVNNLETGSAQAAGRRAMHSLLVGTAVQQRSRRLGDTFRTRIPTFGCESDYAAQILSASEEVPFAEFRREIPV